jgi:hypothetical protein
MYFNCLLMVYRIKPKHVASSKTDKTVVVIDVLAFFLLKVYVLVLGAVK